MFFSPITERSARIRLLYAAIYGLLGLGALTMVVPFLIMIAGSVEPQANRQEIALFPRYLVDDSALWERYIEAKYWGVPDNLRQAWNDPQAAFSNLRLDPLGPAERAAAAEWKRFLNDRPLASGLVALGFQRPSLRMPSESSRAFRFWMLEKFGSLERLNADLGVQFASPLEIHPPSARFLGITPPPTPFVQAFEEFCRHQPAGRKFAWDAGGYYRAVFLPRTVGSDIRDYNAKYRTNHASYAEVPFPPTAPETGRDSWFFFVSRLLRPDFVALTPAGEARRAALGLSLEEFVRTRATAEDLRVNSADTLFAEWQHAVGAPKTLLPQKALDRLAFEEEKSFWRGQFLRLNYVHVLDHLGLHSRAIQNTFILVGLMIAGSLLINPLAAYALSRFKLRLSYHVLLFCLATIAFPAEVTMIPVFLQLKEFHLLNTFAALVLPTLANGFSIFLLKGFFDSLPRELYEAAEIDGASEWTVFWQITMNLSRPILAVLALDAFVAAYGAFFFALIIAPDPQMWTIMVYIYQLRQNVDAPVVYASLILTAIPTLLVFVFCQKIILRGIVVPSEK